MQGLDETEKYDILNDVCENNISVKEMKIVAAKAKKRRIITEKICSFLGVANMDLAKTTYPDLQSEDIERFVEGKTPVYCFKNIQCSSCEHSLTSLIKQTAIFLPHSTLV